MPVTLGGPPQASFEQPLALLSDCHRRIERFLDVLLRITKSRRGGELDEQHHGALLTALEYFRSAAPKHTEDEESSLFPRLQQVADPRVRRMFETLKQLAQDHVKARQAHERVDHLARQWLADGHLETCAVDELDELLSELKVVYESHIRIEDETVFALAKEVLTNHQLAQIGDEMRRRRGLTPHDVK